MPTAAIVATQLTDRGARSKRLNIGGVDYLKPYGAAWSARYSVPIETISLSEEGPGGVSSLTFSIEDPAIQATIALGDEVEYWDIANDVPLFRGFLQSLTIRPEGTLRYLDIVCIGVEAVLDWMLVPSLIVPAGTQMATAVQMLVANATGIGFHLRAFSNPPGSETPFSSQAQPVAGYSPGFPTTQYDVAVDGASLRSACAEVIAACDSWVDGLGAVVTVDFYGGLRLLPTFRGTGAEEGIITTYTPSDYSIPTFENEAASGSSKTTGLRFTLDPVSVIRAVYIVGGNAAGSGLVSDGSGVVGPVSFINEPTSTTAAIRNAIAAAYLSQFSQSIRGTFTVEATTTFQTANVHPGGTWFFAADPQVFGALIGLTVMSIRKTFQGGDVETWDVAVGGFAGSASSQLRRLTRTTRS